MLYLLFQNTFGLKNSLLLNSTEKNLFFGKMDIFLEKWCRIWTNEIIQRFVSWYLLALKSVSKVYHEGIKKAWNPWFYWVSGFCGCQEANPILLKRAKRNFIFPSSPLLSWHITFYKIYSTVPFKSFIYATFRSLKKEPDTVCPTMLGSWFYKK